MAKLILVLCSLGIGAILAAGASAPALSVLAQGIERAAASAIAP